MIDMKALAKPFRPHEIEWRLGATNARKVKKETGDQNAYATMAKPLCYMDARAVANRLDEVCGPENWQNRFPHAANKTCCEIGILINDHWVWKSDGAGDTDIEGEKGAFSDSWKRAATKWGIGRYLYDIDAPWQPIAYNRFTDEALTTLNKIYRDAVWRGPLGIQALKDRITTLVNHINSATSVDDLDTLISANSDILEQCEYDSPSWYYGAGDVPSIDERVAGKREELRMGDAA